MDFRESRHNQNTNSIFLLSKNNLLEVSGKGHKCLTNCLFLPRSRMTVESVEFYEGPEAILQFRFF